MKELIKKKNEAKKHTSSLDEYEKLKQESDIISKEIRKLMN